MNRNSVTIITQPTKRYRVQNFHNLLACHYIDISATLTATKFLLDTGRFWHHRSLHHDLVYSSGTVVQRAHNAIQQINHHPVESVNKFSALSTGLIFIRWMVLSRLRTTGVWGILHRQILCSPWVARYFDRTLPMSTSPKLLRAHLDWVPQNKMRRNLNNQDNQSERRKVSQEPMGTKPKDAKQANCPDGGKRKGTSCDCCKN